MVSFCPIGLTIPEEHAHRVRLDVSTNTCASRVLPIIERIISIFNGDVSEPAALSSASATAAALAPSALAGPPWELLVAVTLPLDATPRPTAGFPASAAPL